MRYFLCFLLIPIFSFATVKKDDSTIVYEDRIQSVFDSLNPQSLKELFAFYHLYKETSFGPKALEKAWHLLNLHRPFPVSIQKHFSIPTVSLDAVVTLMTTGSTSSIPELSLSDLKIIDALGSYLGNRSLKGHLVWDQSELRKLSYDEIDLARSILLHQFDPNKEEEKKKLLLYEASLDLMALQIIAKLSPNASHTEKIEAINHFIFHEMRYRFPPHSMWTKDVDLYTFLPSVMDSRHGVCLGVSILYLSLAQRIDLPLEIVTPPGHIYLSYESSREKINIETTARGMDFPDETYLTVNTRSLQKRNMKEVIGMHFFNHAATAWQLGNHKKAQEFYELAKIYVPNDPLIDTFLAYQYILLGEKTKGFNLLESVRIRPSEHSVYQDTLVEDYLGGMVDESGIKAVFLHVDENRSSILEKQKTLQEVLKKYPRFRDGIFHEAITWLQLGRSKEALDRLLDYHRIDPYNPIVEYYLTILCINRLKYHPAWEHFTILEKILETKNYRPKIVKELKCHLKETYPYSLTSGI